MGIFPARYYIITDGILLFALYLPLVFLHGLNFQQITESVGNKLCEMLFCSGNEHLFLKFVKLIA